MNEMSEAWATHTVCIACYLALNPDVRVEDMVCVRTRPVVCCYHGEVVDSAFAMRAAVADMPHCTMPVKADS